MKQQQNLRFFRGIGMGVILLLAILAQSGFAQDITTPESYFGFQLGSDRNMARWDKIVDYFYLLEKQSEKLRVINMGPSTMGHPFLLVIISSPDNLANLERLQEVNAKLSNPRGIPEVEIKGLVSEGKAVICQSMSLHATEIGGTQMAPELTHDLITRTDKETQRILDNVVFFLIPSFNPDGQIMVTDWYRKTLGTEYEGSSLPWLYHKYVGHDNNRDGDYLNMIESVYAAQIMYRDWPPQAYIDHHHMGSYGARFYVPPYCEPIRPFADPLVWREMSWYGAHIAYKLEEQGKFGILNAGQYPGWGHFGWHWITPFHNIAGMLTESASAKLATPLYIHPEQLRGGARAFPEYEAQTTFPHPWPGGWWRLRDIVEQKKISAWALLDLAARNKETVLWNAYLKAKRQTERGAAGSPKAYVIPKAQHDPLTALKMINTLWQSGIEIQRASSDFSVSGMSYPAGSFVISLAQPKMGLIRNLLGHTTYADNQWTRDRDGTPLRPYDLATHTMFEFMGVRVDPIESAVEEGGFQSLAQPIPVAGQVAAGARSLRIDGRLNDSFRAAGFLLDKGIEVRRIVEPGSGFHAGDFVVPGGSPAVLREAAELTGVDFQALPGALPEGLPKVRRQRLGMYQRYWGGNMDEGWTRFVLEQFGFPYTSLMDAEIRSGGLSKKYDVIILPSDSTGMITGQIPPSARRYISTSVPPEYRSGIGPEGIEALKTFVEEGGVLITFAQACEFAIEEFGLSVGLAAQGIPSLEFYCAGSTLNVSFDNTHPLGLGMPTDGCVVFYSSYALEVIPGQHNERYQTIVRYKDRDILRSGWLIGEEYLANKAAMVSTDYGRGRVVLIGFRTQHRSQTHGTYKLLFNALIR